MVTMLSLFATCDRYDRMALSLYPHLLVLNENMCQMSSSRIDSLMMAITIEKVSLRIALIGTSDGLQFAYLMRNVKETLFK